MQNPAVACTENVAHVSSTDSVSISRRPAWRKFLLVVLLLLTAPVVGNAQDESTDVDDFADFVEPDFPFITTTVDARKMGPDHPAENLTVRGLALQLGNNVYAAFDPDLLRMAVGWTGDFVSLTTMAQVSYDRPKYKQNDVPEVLGDDVFGTGIYPGWMGETVRFEDPRQPGPNPKDVGRGPLPEEYGEWNGVYVAGSDVVLSYSVRGSEIAEQPGSIEVDGEIGITRTFRIDRVSEPLTLVVAEVRNGVSSQVDRQAATVTHDAIPGLRTGVTLAGAPGELSLEVIEDRYVVVRIPAGLSDLTFRTTIWRGMRDNASVLEAMQEKPVTMVDCKDGGSTHWPETVTAQGQVSPDTSALVIDRFGLPIPNPWDRNVRPADIAFFSDGRAAVVTFAGDVWIVSEIDSELEDLTWKRYASGLYEPLTVSIVDDELYVYGREGIVRLHDLNGDGEADFYESFSDLAIQSTESREFPLDMVARPEGGFYLAMGGALNAGPSTSEPIMSGFRAGSKHNGTVMSVSADGQSIDVYATGFRQPYIGLHTPTGTVTASDQQGNFVPSTPLYVLRPGRFYGVPATAHRPVPLPEPMPPLTWIPHFSDDSGASQRYISSSRLGPLSERLVHFSYGRPGPFMVYGDLTADVPQGGVVPVPGNFQIPTYKGDVNPQDGQLYMAGFQIYGSRAKSLKGISRLRYTGAPTTLPADVEAGRQGVVIDFSHPLDRKAALQTTRYTIKRWNYERTEAYGSGHFKLDGSAGEEELPVAAVHVSEDRKSILLVVPDMQETHQMEIGYDLRLADGKTFQNALYLTVNKLRQIALDQRGFSGIAWQEEIERAADQPTVGSETRTVEAAAARGRHLYQEIGCVGCHSVDGTVDGRFGPTFKGLFGSVRTFEDGSSEAADEAYLRESILSPGRHRVAGYDEGMPSYEGILSETEVESIILFIKSVSE